MEVQFTLTDGLNRDISKDKFPASSYYYLLNGRITSTKNATISDVTNVLGNSTAVINNNSLVRSTYTIIGYCTLRDDIILFYATDDQTTDSTTSVGIIDILKYISNESYIRYQLWSGQGLNFRTDKPIVAIGRYESELIQKIYFTDNNNTLKFANVAPDTAGTTNFTRINAYTLNDFSITKDIKLGAYAPQFQSYADGELYGGVIQYAYRLYDKYGTYTLFSDLSAPIILTKGNVSGDILSLYGMETAGQEEDFQTNKGVTITIDLSHSTNSQYSVCEIVSLWCANYNDTPIVHIVGKVPVQNTITFTDRGGPAPYGEITYVDFLLQNANFSAKTLAVKDDILFAGNLNEDYFDLDEELGSVWDARAYRYPVSSTTTALISSVDKIKTSYTETALNTLSATHDAINPYNLEWDTTGASGLVNSGVITGFGNENYAYYPGTQRLGGKGPNIHYYFQQTSLEIDNGVKDDTFNHSIDANNSYYLGRQTSWRRGEVYRFGIVFFDKKGRQSFTKWIGDIKIPDNIISGHVFTGTGFIEKNLAFEKSGDTTYAFYLQPRFYVSNVPVLNGAQLDYKIVWVKREQYDKTILTHGVLTTPYSGYQWLYNPTSGVQAFQSVISPEISLNPNFLANYSSIYVKLYNLYAVADRLDTTEYSTTYQLQINTKKLIESVIPINQNIYTIDDGILVLPTQEYSMFGVPLLNYIFEDATLTSKKIGYGGRRYSFNIIPSSQFVLDIPFEHNAGMELRRNVVGYGGYKYIDRQFNNYIIASDTVSGSTASVIAKYGDTHICMMEYNNCLYNIESEKTSSSTSNPKHKIEIFYFPVESDYNLRLRYDETFGRNMGNKLAYFLQETGNNLISYKDYTGMGNESIDTFTQWGDLYNYDTVFNKPNDIYKYFVKPLDYQSITRNDTLIRYSEKKYNNEEIDSWVQFKPNNFNALNSNYGQLNKLVEFIDYIFYFQDDAVGIASVNPQVTAVSDQGTEVILGTGSVLESFTYLSTDIGCQDNSDVIKSFSALYWLDKNRKKLYTYTSGESGGIGSISDLKNMHSYLANNVWEDSYFNGVYDTKNSQVLMTVRNTANNTLFAATSLGAGLWSYSGTYLTNDITEIVKFVPNSIYKIGNSYMKYRYSTATAFVFEYYYGTLPTAINYDFSNYVFERTNFTLGYNELIGVFESFYSFIPTMYIYHNKNFFTTTNNRDLYQHNKGNYYNYFYGSYYPTTLKIIVSGSSQLQLEKTNVKFFAELRDNKGNYLRNETITNISAKNNYQQSDDIILYPYISSNDLTINKASADVTVFNGLKTVLDNSGTRLGLEYTAGTYDREDIVIYNNQLYRNMLDGNTNLPTHFTWRICELSNIRKTIEHWMTNFPRYISRGAENNLTDYPQTNGTVLNYGTSDRFRASWTELTLELKDTTPYTLIRERNMLLSDIRVVVGPTIY
jgi:hypothetical protein